MFEIHLQRIVHTDDVVFAGFFRQRFGVAEAFRQDPDCVVGMALEIANTFLVRCQELSKIVGVFPPEFLAGFDGNRQWVIDHIRPLGNAIESPLFGDKPERPW